MRTSGPTAAAGAAVPSFAEAAGEAEEQLAEYMDYIAAGDMGPLELAVVTEAMNRVNRQFELTSNVSKAFDDAAQVAIANLK